MEFKEYSNPESQDYDITSNNGEINIDNNAQLPYDIELMDLIGVLDDVSEEELMNNYDITLLEYYNPTAETIEKVKEAISPKMGR